MRIILKWDRNTHIDEKLVRSSIGFFFRVIEEKLDLFVNHSRGCRMDCMVTPDLWPRPIPVRMKLVLSMGRLGMRAMTAVLTLHDHRTSRWNRDIHMKSKETVYKQRYVDFIRMWTSPTRVTILS